MSADNFLGIYKANSRKYVAYNCWSECGRENCPCIKREIFTAHSVIDAVKKAEQELRNPDMIYEYGYRFLNI